jgi:hypothetical protein
VSPDLQLEGGEPPEPARGPPAAEQPPAAPVSAPRVSQPPAAGRSA